MSDGEWWESMYLSDGPEDDFDLSQRHSWRLTIPEALLKQRDWNKLEDDDYLIQSLRPLAESLSLLEYASNNSLTHWRDWLPAAWRIALKSRTEKWQELSWIKNLEHESSDVEEAYQSWQTVKRLSKGP